MKRYNPQRRKFIRTLKANASIAITVCLIMGGIFVYMWPRIELITLTYDYNNYRSKQKKLKEHNRLLNLELSSIKSLEKIEKIATEKLGMIEPKDKNIIFVKVKS